MNATYRTPRLILNCQDLTSEQPLVQRLMVRAHPKHGRVRLVLNLEVEPLAEVGEGCQA